MGSGQEVIFLFLWSVSSQGRAEVKLENTNFSPRLPLPPLTFPEKPSHCLKFSAGLVVTLDLKNKQKSHTGEEVFPKINGKSVTMMMLSSISHCLSCPSANPTPFPQLIFPKGSVVGIRIIWKGEAYYIQFLYIFFYIET